MHPQLENQLLLTRRHFFGRAGLGIGSAALASLLNGDLAAAPGNQDRSAGGLPGLRRRAALAGSALSGRSFCVVTRCPRRVDVL